MELHDIIIPHLKGEQGLLLAYGAVCRSWDNAVWPYRRLLFQRIYLTNDNISSFAILLRVSPRIIPCIRAVSAKCPLVTGKGGRMEVLDLSVLGTLPHVDELRLDELPITPNLTTSISGLAARIRELEIGVLGVEDPFHFAQFVRLFTCLQRLYIKDRPELVLSLTPNHAQLASHRQLDGMCKTSVSFYIMTPSHLTQPRNSKHATNSLLNPFSNMSVRARKPFALASKPFVGPLSATAGALK